MLIINTEHNLLGIKKFIEKPCMLEYSIINFPEKMPSQSQRTRFTASCQPDKSLERSDIDIEGEKVLSTL